MKAVLKFVVVLFALAAGALFILSRFEIRLPAEMLDRYAEAISTSNLIVRIDSVCLRFPTRIRANGFRLLDSTKTEARPFLSADRVDICLSFSRFPWRLENLVKTVTVTTL